MYWSDWGEEAKIEKAGMDGSHRGVLVKSDIKWPNGLAIDYVDNRLYWVDAKLHLIGSSDLFGESRRVVLTSSLFLHHPFSLAVFEDTVYWTDWETESVHRASKFNGSEIRNVIARLITPMDIHVYHPLKQPAGKNRCGTNNGGCSHLCLPAPKINSQAPDYSCACPNNVEMSEDGRNCLIPGKSRHVLELWLKVVH